MTSPVRISAIWPGLIVASCDAARSNPADSSVPYAGRGTVASSRRILSRIRAAYLVFIVLLVVAPAAAQVAAPQAAAPNLDARFPLDPAIRTGTLPNGLSFFIRRNEQPDNRVSLRLVVKAGSIDEAPDQLGLAHLL